MQPTLSQGPKVGLRNHEEALSQLILLGIEPVMSTSQVEEIIPKSSPSWIHYKLRVCFFGWELEGAGADAGNTTSASNASPTNLPTSELSSKSRLVIRLYYRVRQYNLTCGPKEILVQQPFFLPFSLFSHNQRRWRFLVGFPYTYLLLAIARHRPSCMQ